MIRAARRPVTDAVVLRVQDGTRCQRSDAVAAEEQEYNVVTVRLARPFDASVISRNFYATSSCGICGKASLDQVAVRCDPLPPGPVVAGSIIASLPDKLRTGQRIFDRTGGLQAGDLPLTARILQVSGRLSFEIVQKAAVAGAQIVSAVSAPSSLAVDAAERLGVTLVGFVRPGGFNVYARPERVDPAA